MIECGLIFIDECWQWFKLEMKNIHEYWTTQFIS